MPCGVECCSSEHCCFDRRRLETIDRVEQLVQLATDEVPSLFDRLVVCLQAREVVVSLEDLERGRNVVVVLERVLLDDLAVLPADSLVALDSRRTEEAAVELVGRDALVAFVLHLASGRPRCDELFAEHVVGREDCGQAEDRGEIGVEGCVCLCRVAAEFAAERSVSRSGRRSVRSLEQARRRLVRRSGRKVSHLRKNVRRSSG